RADEIAHRARTQVGSGEPLKLNLLLLAVDLERLGAGGLVVADRKAAARRVLRVAGLDVGHARVNRRELLLAQLPIGVRRLLEVGDLIRELIELAIVAEQRVEAVQE